MAKCNLANTHVVNTQPEVHESLGRAPCGCMTRLPEKYVRLVAAVHPRIRLVVVGLQAASHWPLHAAAAESRAICTVSLSARPASTKV